MVNKQHAQFSDENGNIFYLENETEDVLDPSGKPLSNGGDLSEASVTFTPDATRKLPQSGGRFKAFLGSIVKFLSDLTEVAFSGNYSDLEGKPTIPPLANNCTTTAAGYGLDARQGKVLMDKANQLSSEIEALNDEGAIKGLEVREGDGVYITYQDGADTVSKKLGSPADSIRISGGGFNGVGQRSSGGCARIFLSDIFERIEVAYTTDNSSRKVYRDYFKDGALIRSEEITAGSSGTFVFYPDGTIDEVMISMWQNSTMTFRFEVTGYF